MMNIRRRALKSSGGLIRSRKLGMIIAITLVAGIGFLYFLNQNRDYNSISKAVLENEFRGGHRISGRVVRITDGDTFEMLVAGNKKLRIRIHGIDAPEREQPFYRKSRDFLGTLCFQKQVSIQIVNKDRWGRLVAHAFTPDGQSIGYKMVENGFAWHFTRYSNDPTLRRLENSARKNKAGLWADKNPVAPWKWRRGNKG